MSIQTKKLNYTYQIGTPLEHVALKDVSINIEDGSYTAIVGHTGSGKSTLLQHLNGLLKPTSGEISINGYTIDNTLGYEPPAYNARKLCAACRQAGGIGASVYTWSIQDAGTPDYGFSAYPS